MTSKPIRTYRPGRWLLAFPFVAIAFAICFVLFFDHRGNPADGWVSGFVIAIGYGIHLILAKRVVETKDAFEFTPVLFPGRKVVFQKATLKYKGTQWRGRRGYLFTVFGVVRDATGKITVLLPTTFDLKEYHKLEQTLIALSNGTK